MKLWKLFIYLISFIGWWLNLYFILEAITSPVATGTVCLKYSEFGEMELEYILILSMVFVTVILYLYEFVEDKTAPNLENNLNLPLVVIYIPLIKKKKNKRCK